MTSNNNARKYKVLVIMLVIALVGSVLIRLEVNQLEYNNQNSIVTTLVKVDPKYKTPIHPPSSRTTTRVKIGAYLGGDESWNLERTIYFEQLLGYRLSYKLIFIDWGNQDNLFPSERIRHYKTLGYTPIITWEPWKRDFINPEKVQPRYSLASIANGQHDEYITRWAMDLKSYRDEVIIRFGHEMTSKVGETNWYPWQGDPVNYRKAFIRISSIFDQVGATNAKMMWNPIHYADITNSDRFYPGGEYVDYIGMTVINLGNVDGIDGSDYDWLDCNYVLATQLNPVKKFNKPMIISEILTTDVGGSKAGWLGQCMQTVAKNNQVKAMLFYQSNIGNERWTRTRIDWKFTTNSRTLNAVRNAILRYL